MTSTFVEDLSTILDLSLQQPLVSLSEKNYLMTLIGLITLII
jgi:hypothetical protein